MDGHDGLDQKPPVRRGRPPAPPKHPITERRDAQRKILMPLIEYLRKLYQDKTYDQAGRILGMEYWQVQRILSSLTKSPNWVDLTEIIVASGLTPNQAAAMTGLYKPPKDTTTPTVDPRLEWMATRLYESGLTDDVRNSIIANLTAILDAQVKLFHESQQQVSRQVGGRARTRKPRTPGPAL